MLLDMCTGLTWTVWRRPRNHVGCDYLCNHLHGSDSFGHCVKTAARDKPRQGLYGLPEEWQIYARA